MHSSKVKLITTRLKGIHAFADQHMRAINGAPHMVDKQAIQDHAAQYETIIDEVKAIDPELVAGFELSLSSYYPFRPLTKVFSYLDQLKVKTASLPAILDAAQKSENSANRDALSIALNLCKQAGESINFLQTGHGKRDPLARKMNGEKDFQDFMHGFLKLSFDDIRPEDYVASHGGSNSAIDFVLKDEQIVIEVKGPRASLTDHAAGDELFADIGRYKNHPDCKTLIFCIFNVDGAIKNPVALKKDIEKESTATMQVKVVIIS